MLRPSPEPCYGRSYIAPNFLLWIFFVCEFECLLLQVKEIEQEGYTEPETAQKKETKQTAAVDLSKRLKDFRSVNDASSLRGFFFLFTLQTFLNHNCLFMFKHKQQHTENVHCMLIAPLFPEKNLFRKFFHWVVVIISSSSNLQTVVISWTAAISGKDFSLVLFVIGWLVVFIGLAWTNSLYVCTYLFLFFLIILNSMCSWNKFC